MSEQRAIGQIERYHLREVTDCPVTPGENLPKEYWQWSQWDLNRIRNMIDAGYQLVSIADELGRPYRQVKIAIILWNEEGKL